MTVELMRRIDFWLGLPLCFILSIFNKIYNIFAKGKCGNTGPKKILFLELSEMGSAILSYPAMKAVKEMYPEATLYFWIFEDNRASVDILKIVPEENVITINRKTFFKFVIDTARNLYKVRRKGIDILLDLELFSRYTSILTYLSGATARVGFYKYTLEGLYRGNLYTHRVMYNPYVHISVNFLNLVYSLQKPKDESPILKMRIESRELSLPKLKSSESARKNIWGKLKRINKTISEDKRIVVLNPGSSYHLPLRKWPIENYIELAERFLAENSNIIVVLIGAKDDVLSGKYVIREINSDRCIDLTGRTNLQELVDLFNISALLVLHDSGPIHFASLTPINMIVLFGPETPKLYSPLTANKVILYEEYACSPCLSAYNHRRSLCRDNHCLKAITVDKVYDIAKRILNREDGLMTDKICLNNATSINI